MMDTNMTRDAHSTDEEPAAPPFPRGAHARRALILRRAANRNSHRILRSFGGEARRAVPPPLPIERPEFELVLPSSTQSSAPLGRPVEPEAALEEERNRWGGRL